MPSAQDQIPANTNVSLLCSKCGMQMRLTLLMPAGPNKETRTFDCDYCGRAETIDVKY